MAVASHGGGEREPRLPVLLHPQPHPPRRRLPPQRLRGADQGSRSPSSGAGAVLCNVPIRFHDPATNSSASFSTRFSFSITNTDPGTSGDGLTFFLSPENQTLGAAGESLGLFNASQPSPADSSIVAVEFDTFMNAGIGDPSSNHVGLDIGGARSRRAITAWVEFLSGEKTFSVWVSSSGDRPAAPVFSTAAFDLSVIFQEFMYVGFSASTEGSTEVHAILDWSFRTFGLPEGNLSSPAANSSSDGSPGGVIPAMPISSPERRSSHRKLSLALVIAGPVVFFCLVFSLVAWVSLMKLIRLRKRERFTPELLKGPRNISYRELSAATGGFHRSRIVGNGSFGCVYRATDPSSGMAYAVKRSSHSRQGKSEFMAELTIIARLRHKNLVQLVGWCAEKDELLLVYEFMPNGSLDKVLHETRRPSETLDWARRVRITRGVVSVLIYLHQECEQQVIHRDIKTSNIMLDAHFNARLGDFGLARLMDHDKSPDCTLTAGTMGYLAPEYVQYGKATEKTDVFSFGVVLLEICSGRRPIEKLAVDSGDMVNLVDWVWNLYSNNKLLEAADPSLKGEFDGDEMVRLLLVGLSCVNPNSGERPSMRRVLRILNGEAELLLVPRMKPLPVFSHSLPPSPCKTLFQIEILIPLTELRPGMFFPFHPLSG
ncbi:unnamed protein product [Spirodela intermedia]|uniref:non-specific serine/threonine protein kinase n=1 Tax=Spirodela intermedia TaxID=51605 RepID=A0A7I8JKL0_SPIIN|nr:unnamed protein product [Spirodela intermedia]CAA6670694.1 unnamed protein product [Spirodela intermedia]